MANNALELVNAEAGEHAREAEKYATFGVERIGSPLLSGDLGSSLLVQDWQ